MNSQTIVLLASLALVAAAVVCMVMALRRRGGIGVWSSLELTPQDGWSLLNLAVVNRHDTKVWVEQATFVLTDLDADMQSGPASGCGSVGIREFIRSGEALCVSLIEAVYNAAGKPQGVYSFLCRCTIHYRLGEKWLESESPVSQVEMVRLSAMRLRHVRTNRHTTPSAGSASAQSPFNSNETPRVEESRTSKPEEVDARLPPS